MGIEKYIVGGGKKESLICSVKRAKKKKSIILRIFLIVFFGGYALFFTSNSWYPSSSNLVSATKINRETSWVNRQVSILSWTYSESQRLMEVQLEINSTAVDGIDNYEYSALDRKKGFFNVTPVIEQDDFVVLHITGIDKGWSEISLRMQIPKNKQTDDNSKKVLKLYTNKKAVQRTNTIKNKTTADYMMERLNSKVSGYESAIANLQKENNNIQSQIDARNKDINDLRGREEYQTENEIEKTEAMIKQAENDNENDTRTIDTNNESIKEYQKRILKAKEEMKLYGK